VADDKYKRSKNRKKKLAKRNRYDRTMIDGISTGKRPLTRKIQPYEEYNELSLKDIKSLDDLESDV
jgi:hypothetical protein